MSITTQRVILPWLAATAVGITAPAPLAAQLVSARPASVALTVVVPPKPSSDGALISEGVTSLINGRLATIDLETTIGVIDRAPARIEVRLGAMWSVDSTRVWVRNPQGEFERLQADARVVALDTPGDPTAARSVLRFRVEPGSLMAESPLVIPLEYRVTVGSGDAFSVWTFPSRLRVEGQR
jgi:hypothetical protein